MPAPTDIRSEIRDALGAFATQPLARAAAALFGTLGYRSDRTLDFTTAKEFLTLFDGKNATTEKDREALFEVSELRLLFQISDAELTIQRDLMDDPGAVQTTKIESYLFFAAELPAGSYTRTALSTIVRTVNKPVAMPALVLFRHGDTVSIGIIHRRLHKRDQAKDVLEKVTLIKDIAFADPIRAHIEILNDFAVANLDADFGVSNFVRLHEAWQKRLGSYALSNNFYREIADWYFWAHHQVDDGTIRLPLHCDTEQENSLFLIRLLTRIIFSWFLVEKRLIPSDLFREQRLKSLLKEFNPSRDPRNPDIAPSYYHAVLQNLFFGTLNMPPEQRSFREKKKDGQRYDQNYGITNLWRYETEFRNPADWIEIARRVPFLNGGLFDCLDDKSGKKTDNFILDGFSDNPKHACHLPNDLFFGPERTVDLSHDYGEEDKRTARSKKAKVRGLIEILSRYKFTIEENTPLEEEIALDPELLGKVFENLLASYNEDTRTTARKALGAFYTPREIVSYMVDEALKSYLATQVPRCKGALEDLFSNKATLKEIKPETRDALIAAIGRVKILDPACGSGAFPMGALHRLVDLLQKLDPNNESWKRDRLAEARRYRKLLEETGAAQEELAACDARIADIEKSFDTRFHALDFARKLYLIENSIYGVDIQPIATQIAKLRFFISLVVDQKVDMKADNLGVRPLPNLETRLVAADTLIPIPKPKENQGHLFDDASPEAYRKLERLKSDLTAIRHEHFNARSPAAKRKWREADEAKRSEIAQLLQDNHAMSAQAARKLSAWDPYDQNAFAPFFDSEWMFGLPVGKVRIQGNVPSTLLGNLALINEVGGQTELTASATREIDSGFDIVIGNPPYIRIQTLKQKDPDIVAFYKDLYASAAKGNYDIYVVFIEAGLRLLKSDGHLAYICPHKFFNAQYGEPIREVIAKGRNLRHVVHFGDEQVFPGATIYTCLLFLANGGSPDCRFIKAHDLEGWKGTFSGTEGKFPSSNISNAEWNFTVGPSRAVIERLFAHKRNLGDLTTHIFQGLVTSADPVYLLDQIGPIEDGLVPVSSPATGKTYKLEEAIVRPLCKGSLDILRWRITTSKRVVFPYDPAESATTGSTVLISAKDFAKSFPRVWAYLLENRKTLEDRENGKMRNERWYGFVYPKSVTLFAKAKIMTPSIANAAAYSLDEHGEFYFVGSGGGGGGGYGIIQRSDSLYSNNALLGLLNSQAADFVIRQTASRFQGGYYAYNKQFIERLPIPDISAQQSRNMSDVVKVALTATERLCVPIEAQTTRDPLMLAYWERVLNGLVYELYFPEEVHGAGLRLFDLVEHAQLPDINAIPEPERLPRLRQLFETLHDGTHPLRIALDKLQTLDTVRIIEGKA